MKHIYKLLFGLLGVSFFLTACNDWLDTEIKDPADLLVSNKSEEYYARLRQYKKSDHPVAFGWFGNWTGTGASYENSLKGLPDSVDFVSLWGNWKNPSPAMLEDLRYVQEKKGTKALVCFLVLDIGDQITPPLPDKYKEEYEKASSAYERYHVYAKWRHEFWGWDHSEENRLKAAEKYANAICDTIDKYNYDGFDLDAEPNLLQPFQTNKELWGDGKKVIAKFVETMSKRIGPKSGTGKLFVVDGEPDALPDTLFSHLDYLILQAYTTYFKQKNENLDTRFQKQYAHFKEVAAVDEIAKKLIICEDFEKHAKGGGADFILPDGTTINSLSAFAYWNPSLNGVQYRKGGVGTFHMEYEYKVNAQSTDTYPALRKAIQIQNPSIK
ncbi:glycoside hydrolase family 18 [Bacteroides pyogenes]|uniref:glycoside hydrolase family 18 n=1 Tax=Bacteroides pyogenes TaxID=310300 RepID=UPI0011E3FA60|nr:glycoside hydrolase family 18 [Bacteroides pyogenes]MBR8708347.1 hypothetical protein [Bacteroides pyogenes]MBR8716812.1 hypothetical protein [Bacteroides pyogenes]MBR8746721.1 hypothetical protein [Bacteroides pyogenes]MBR8756993.1 hypothetical protein [Bacteroides pyogenes]MBR8780216.1 hypothetical protein [Bacteroides pyogenes]